jgi:hypothetical protein
VVREAVRSEITRPLGSGPPSRGEMKGRHSSLIKQGAARKLQRFVYALAILLNVIIAAAWTAILARTIASEGITFKTGETLLYLVPVRQGCPLSL